MSLILKGQAKVVIIIPNPLILIQTLSIQRKMGAADISISMSVIYFFTEYSGAGLKYYWSRNNNFNFRLFLL